MCTAVVDRVDPNYGRDLMWFVYDLEDGFELYETKDEALTAFVEFLARYRENATLEGWNLEVEHLCMGRVTHTVALLPVSPIDWSEMIENEASSVADYYEAFVDVIDE